MVKAIWAGRAVQMAGIIMGGVILPSHKGANNVSPPDSARKRKLARSANARPVQVVYGGCAENTWESVNSSFATAVLQVVVPLPGHAENQCRPVDPADEIVVPH